MPSTFRRGKVPVRRLLCSTLHIHTSATLKNGAEDEEDPDAGPVSFPLWSAWVETSSGDNSGVGLVHPVISAGIAASKDEVFNIYAESLQAMVAICDQPDNLGPEERSFLEKLNSSSGGSLLSAVLHRADSVSIFTLRAY